MNLSLSLKHTYGDTSSKTWNILARQIACTSNWKYNWQIYNFFFFYFFLPNILRAPTDCVQYFTGVSGNVKSYNFAGSQVLQTQNYG